MPRTVFKNRTKWSNLGLEGPRSLAIASGFKGFDIFFFIIILVDTGDKKKCGGVEKGTRIKVSLPPTCEKKNISTESKKSKVLNADFFFVHTIAIHLTHRQFIKNPNIFFRH